MSGRRRTGGAPSRDPTYKPLVSAETEVVELNQLVPLYRVVLLDDNDHTYDYVIEMLQQIFIFSLDQAYRHAEEVDRCGRTVHLGGLSRRRAAAGHSHRPCRWY